MGFRNKKLKIIHNGHTPIVDEIAWLGVIGPIMAIPQAYIVWQGRGIGVSLITWLTFLAVSIMWLLYGLAHKLKPIIFIQIIWVLVNSAVVIGILLHR